jgi:hypothetical protein
MTDEDLKLALEALEHLQPTALNSFYTIGARDKAITAIKQALAAPVQDSTCNNTLRTQGKAYPRTCKKCGLGPCIGAPKQPSAVPAPVQSAERGEPVAWWDGKYGSPVFAFERATPGIGLGNPDATPLYTAPPAAPDLQAELDATNRQVEILCDALAESRRQRQWVGLSDEEMQALWGRYAHMEMMRAIEAKLKEKNNG